MEYIRFCCNFVAKTMRRLKKNYFLALFCSTVGILGLTRWATGEGGTPSAGQHTETADTTATDAAPMAGTTEDSSDRTPGTPRTDTVFPLPKRAESKPRDGRRPHPIYSVPSYTACFPDLQDVQIVSARKMGVRPVQNRQEAELRKKRNWCT